MKAFATLLLLIMLAAGLGAWLVYVPYGPSAATPVDLDIASGTGSRSIAIQLEKAGVIRSRYAFYLLRIFKHGRLEAGEYLFDHPATALEVYSRILRGDVYTVSVTIPEGYNIFDIADAVDKAGLVPRDRFLAAERSETGLISDLSPDAASLEGYLFPDTYRFPHHATPRQMLAAMVRRFRKEAAQLGLIQKDGVPHSSGDVSRTMSGTDSLTRIVTLASLVEKEVRENDERPLVAGVFENRLAKGMPLATDPTVIYAALLNDRWRGTIYASDLKFDSPYNTYIHTGLPPGPICNPGIAALKAAISPAPSDYLYFVADARGHSRFSATLQQHDQQVEDYRRASHQ
ncbi:MAG TPA: endolytic transglycosylase MltG [Acidobacteriaceae bacterium]|nr:endolytic transglycosylase MltG [Acidobacteriaceae bacterium]